ncbi:MAG TPA: RNA polymerase sigma factor SigJ [Nocardioidaceae bacterium]|jgi:RNA polymerase sigma-70 factor (ECF subfamily)
MTPSGAHLDLAERYDELRPFLIGVCYRILGSRSEAEDVVQDGYVRLHETVAGAPERVPADLRAWATRVVSRIAIDRLRSARVRREAYVGQWLPEPWIERQVEGADADPQERVTLAESVSYALMVVLESLSPAERTSWVLHDSFGVPYDEVAAIVGRSPEACRQLAARARKHIHERAPRFEVDWHQQHRVVESFLRAAGGQDLHELLQLLDPSVTLTSDGGGKVAASRHPVHGADQVAKLMVGIVRRAPHVTRADVAAVNGLPGVLVYAAEQLVMVMSFAVADGRVTAIDLVVNPDKLADLAGPRA